MRTSSLLAFFGSLSVVALGAGCVVDSPGEPPPPLTLVTVDTGATLTSPPGEGAGVNVEYQAGGHWHVWWTCDTHVSGLPCTFYVDVIAESGSITNATGDQLESDDSLATPASNEVTLNTNTTTGVDGVFFDTDPGATINVLQQIGDVQDGTYFYWGQNGQVMGGGDPSNVADPLSFVGSSP
ncbi:MAG TPA: hypothetical protein VIF09_06555 [Polyangiaceae bacterium]|jgi:hypothetical protein